MTTSPATPTKRALRIGIQAAGVLVGLTGLVLVIVGIVTHQPVLLVMVSSLLAVGGASVATMYRSKKGSL